MFKLLKIKQNLFLALNKCYKVNLVHNIQNIKVTIIDLININIASRGIKYTITFKFLCLLGKLHQELKKQTS
jgi:hypothetical protein